MNAKIIQRTSEHLTIRRSINGLGNDYVTIDSGGGGVAVEIVTALGDGNSKTALVSLDYATVLEVARWITDELHIDSWEALDLGEQERCPERVPRGCPRVGP